MKKRKDFKEEGNNYREDKMTIEQELKKRSKESKVILVFFIAVILYLVNTTKERIISTIPNFWFSLILSGLFILIWGVLTKK